MINFFLTIFSDLDNFLFFLIMSLIFNMLPYMLGFLFSFFYKNFRFKKVWLVLWFVPLCIIIAEICIIIATVLRKSVFAVSYVSYGLIISLFLTLLFYFIFSLLGRVFKVKNICHWLILLLILILSFFNFTFMDWSISLHSFGKIEDKPLQSTELESAYNMDYEIKMSHSDAWGFDERMIIIRERNDSIFYLTVYSMCRELIIQEDSIEGNVIIQNRKTEGDSSAWTLLDSEKSTIVKNLKKAIENYEQEYTSEMIFDGYMVSISLKDYKQKKKRVLNFDNTDISYVHKAMAIEKMMDSLQPPREAFTSFSYDEVASKCAEKQNDIMRAVKKVQTSENTDTLQNKNE